MDEQSVWDEQQQYIERVRQWNAQRYGSRGEMPMVYLKTFGCQQNVSDGEKLSGMLAAMGYGFCDDPEYADMVLYNTCAVRENAENRVFGHVGALVHAKRRKPELLIGLCGCMMQQEHIVQKLKKSYPYVDLIFGTHALPAFPQLLYRKLTEPGRVIDISASDGAIVEDIPVRRDGTVKAWLPIMYGCDNFCTYCVVPLVRGRERSRSPERILEEARSLVAEGFREIMLLGQNVNSYGKGLESPVNFAQLLRQICAIEGDFRLRFMTSHPRDCTRELIDTIAENPKICNHLHLPVQSGSNRLLAQMNRHYTVEEYLELIRYAKQRIPDISFTSDIIVGFPGETEEDFAATLRLVEEVGYHSLFTFLYSPREGTKAAKMPDTIPHEVKTERFSRLLDVQQRIGMEKYHSLVGKTVRVLVDGEGKTGEGYMTGRTESNIIVDFSAPKSTLGQFVEVKVTKALNWAVLGEQITTNHDGGMKTMDVIQAARELGKVIQQDERYLRMMKAQENNDQDEELQELIFAFNVLRNELNTEVKNPDKDAEKIKEMDREVKAKYAQIFNNENMIEFSAAREDFQQMLTFINQIINGSAAGDDPDTIEYQEACGGDCSGCSGC